MTYSRPGVYISERLLQAPIAGGNLATAAGAVVAPFPQGPETVTKVNSWYEFTKAFGGYNASYPATFQVASFFNNRGTELYVKRIMHSDAASASIPLQTSGGQTVATVTAKNAGSDGNNLRVTVSAGTGSGYYNLTLTRETVSGTAQDTTNDILLEQYNNVVFNDASSSDYAPTVINLVSPNISVAVSGSGTIASAIYPLAGGSNGSTPVAADYTSYKSTGDSVFAEFDSVNRPLVIFLPEIDVTLATIGVPEVYEAAIAWADANNGFVVAETGADVTNSGALSFATSLGASSNAAVYYPHMFVTDPVGRSSGALRKIGPSAAIAGLYLATDATAGVFKAPAGLTAQVQGVVALEKQFTSAELDAINSAQFPVNPIRQLPGAGAVVMGARTLLQDGTANKYVNMRRSLINIKKNLENLTQFAVFQNNDEKLWAQIKTVISVFLNDYRNQGGLRGATAAQAFYVKCDAENNTAATIANGEVHIQVGVALEYPAEFVVIDLSQITQN